MKSIFLVISFILFFSWITTQSESTDGSGSVAGDRQALMELYEATGGDSWTTNTGWGDGDPSGDWHGLEVNAEGRVTRVDLYDNNLQGTLPASIGNLGKLRYLNLKNNYLTGPIPPEIGNLASLEILILQGRTYKIGNTLKEPPLDNMDIYEHHQGKRYSNTNDFSGPIPPEVGNLSELRILELSNARNITGPLPEEIGNLTKLEGLYLSGNDFGGETLPSSWGNLASIRHIYMESVGLEGEIPSSWGNLTTLSVLNFGEFDRSDSELKNELTGDIPDFSGFTTLSTLDISQNKLTGQLPHYFNNGNFTDLNILNVSGNELTGTLFDFNNLQNLYYLGVGGNKLTGDIQTLTNLPAKIRIIQVWHNEFSGEFPQEGWPDFFQLKTAYVGWNPISGNIPCSFWEKLDNPKLGIAKFAGMDIADPCASGAEAMEGNGDIDLTY